MATMVKQGIRPQSTTAVIDAEPGGFEFLNPEELRFDDLGAFHAALKDQQQATEQIPAEGFSAIGPRGELEGTAFRLSKTAFSDLCNLSGIPSRFIKDVAGTSPDLATELVSDRLTNVFFRSSPKSLVVDRRTNRVDGIVSAERYRMIDNLETLDLALSAGTVQFSTGWLSGPRMRATMLSSRVAEPRKGDVVQFGASLRNGMQGDSALEIASYALRLVCTNGMTHRTAGDAERIVHLGDAQDRVLPAIARMLTQGSDRVRLMELAAHHMMMPNQVRAFREWTGNPRNGGSAKLDLAVVKQARMEAISEGRADDQPTLWNFVNGITQQAHEAPGMRRKLDIETMGDVALTRFAREWCLN